MTHPKRPRFFDRFAPAIVLTSILSLFTSGLVGCEAEPLPDLDDVSADAGTDDSDDFRSLEQAAAAISQDAVFHQMLSKMVELTIQRTIAQSQMTDEDLDAFARTIGHPEYPWESVGLDDLAEAAGIDLQLILDQRGLVLDLIDKHDLDNLTPAQIESVFAMAAGSQASQNYIKGSIEYELEQLDEPVEPGIDQCEAVCIAQYAVAAASALNTYIAALAAAAATSGPLVGVTVAIVTAAYFVALATAQKSLDDCMAICHGEVPSGEECLKDSDCASNEFCWTGVVGVGQNDCRPKKAQSATCSRHGQCLSGCCKLHFFTNPFSKTCRPASACN